jgi:hypothetical protein
MRLKRMIGADLAPLGTCMRKDGPVGVAYKKKKEESMTRKKRKHVFLDT